MVQGIPPPEGTAARGLPESPPTEDGDSFPASEPAGSGEKSSHCPALAVAGGVSHSSPPEGGSGEGRASAMGGSRAGGARASGSADAGGDQEDQEGGTEGRAGGEMAPGAIGPAGVPDDVRGRDAVGAGAKEETRGHGSGKTVARHEGEGSKVTAAPPIACLCVGAS